MSALDVIPIPGHPGKYARRAFVDAWQAAGSPPINSAGRLYADQKHFYDGWKQGKPGFHPADNPDHETQRLAHVRFVAGDIDPTPERVRRLSAAGLIRPYSYEPWHWELPSVRTYSIVRALPSTAGGNTAARKEDSMFIAIVRKTDWYMVVGGKACLLGAKSNARKSGAPILEFPDDWSVQQLKTVVSGVK